MLLGYSPNPLFSHVEYRQYVDFFSTMKPINEQIKPSFIAQAKKLSQFKQLLDNILPVECRNHVQVANIRNQNLMLITDSPVWTTRVRQLSPQILQYIQENTSTSEVARIIHHIQISTRYHSTDDRAHTDTADKKLHRAEISEKTANLLSQSANSINHLPLKKALLKIASHSKSAFNKQTKTEK